MRIMQTLAAAAMLGLTWSAAAPAVAQDADSDVITDPVRDEVRALTRDLDGWYLNGGVGTSISFTHNSKVVGNLDGVNFQLGVLLNGRAQLHQGLHDWVTEATIQTTFSKLPNIDSFLKTQDAFDFRTTYAFHIPDVEWLGPFVRAGFSTQIFNGYAVRDEDTTVVETLTNGTTRSRLVDAQEQIKLTSYFEPFQLRELVGMFADAVTEEMLTLTIELGVGAQQVFTQEGFVLTDDDDTPELELKQLQDFQQVGAELGLQMAAKVQDNLTWAFRTNVMQPFYSSLGGKDGIDGLNVEMTSKLSLRLASWASLDYVLQVRRIPLVLDEWQVQNGLLFTAGFNVERRPEPPAATAQ